MRKYLLIIPFLLFFLFVSTPVWAQMSGGTISGGTGCTSTGTSILKGNGSGGCANATAGTDYLTGLNSGEYNVVDKGGCDTGSSDNSTCLSNSFTAAKAANQCVYLPAGTFQITSPVNTTDVTDICADTVSTIQATASIATMLQGPANTTTVSFRIPAGLTLDANQLALIGVDLPSVRGVYMGATILNAVNYGVHCGTAGDTGQHSGCHIMSSARIDRTAGSQVVGSIGVYWETATDSDMYVGSQVVSYETGVKSSGGHNRIFGNIWTHAGRLMNVCVIVTSGQQVWGGACTEPQVYGIQIKTTAPEYTMLGGYFYNGLNAGTDNTAIAVRCDSSGSSINMVGVQFQGQDGTHRWATDVSNCTLNQWYPQNEVNVLNQNLGNITSSTLISPAGLNLSVKSASGQGINFYPAGTGRFGMSGASFFCFTETDNCVLGNFSSGRFAGLRFLSGFAIAIQSKLNSSNMNSLTESSTDRLLWQGSPLGFTTFTTKTGDYTFVEPDKDTCFRWSDSADHTLTLPTPTSGTAENGYAICVENATGNHVLTLTPTGAVINGASSVAVYPNVGAIVSSDGTNYHSRLFSMSGIPSVRGDHACVTASNNGTTYTCNLSPNPIALSAGDLYAFQADIDNATGPVTINFDSISAVTIKKMVNGSFVDLAAHDIRATGWEVMVYDGTNMQLISPIGNATGTGATVLSASPTLSGNITMNGAVFYRGVNAQSGTSYTIVAGDEDKLLTFNNASAVAVTLPQATTTGFTSGAFFHVFNRGAGAVTITPTTSTINGAATLVLNQSQGAEIVSDGTNYSAWVSSSPTGSGTVTTTGSPANGNLAKFSGATSVTNTDLTGDVTTSGGVATTIAANAVTSGKMAVVNTRRTVCFVIGANNASAAIQDADLGPQSRQYFVNAAWTLVEITVAADAGTPNIILGNSHAGSITNLTSAALSTAASGGIACSNAGGTTGIDGATTCSPTLQNTSFVAGDWITLVSGTAGGTAKEMTACATFTVN